MIIKRSGKIEEPTVYEVEEMILRLMSDYDRRRVSFITIPVVSG